MLRRRATLIVNSPAYQFFPCPGSTMDFSDPENENAFRAFYICDKRGTILLLEQCRDNETTSVLLLPSASLFFPFFFFFVTDRYGLIYSAVSKKSFSSVKSTVAESI